jgi:nicotinamidase-related amidase
MEFHLKQWLEPRKCALIVVDMQNDYCSDKGYLASQGNDISAISSIVPLVSTLIYEARKVGALIVFTRQTALPEGLSDAPARRFFRNKTRPGHGPYPLRGTWGHTICDDFEIVDSDLIIEKHRPSAFHGTSLDLLLRANGRETTLVCGTATEGCVESTVRDAANHDYLPVVLNDCITSSKKELHDASLKVMSARYNTVISRDLIEHWTSKSERFIAAEN